MESSRSRREDPAKGPQKPKDPLGLFRIEPGSATPPFLQLHETVVEAVRERRLLPGQRLPTVRALAAHLGLAANTVAAAYRSLEKSGIAEGRGRAGTFIRMGDDPIGARSVEIARDAAAALRALGVAKNDALRLVSDVYDAAP